MLLGMYFAFIEALKAIFSITDKWSRLQSRGLLSTKMLIVSDIRMSVKYAVEDTHNIEMAISYTTGATCPFPRTTKFRAHLLIRIQ